MAIFPRVKVWVSNEILTANDLNTEFNNVLNHFDAESVEGFSSSVGEMQTATDPYPNSAESLASNVAGELQRIRFVLRRLAGKPQWYIPTTYNVDSPVPTVRIEDAAITPAKLQNFDNTDAVTRANTGIPTEKIRDGAITRPKLANRTVSQSVVIPTGNTQSTTFVDVASTFSITTLGGPVYFGINAGESASVFLLSGVNVTAEAEVRVVRTTNAVDTTVYTGGIRRPDAPAALVLPTSIVWGIDTPPAGTHSYRLQLRVMTANGSSIGVATTTARLIGYEL